ncbi:MAG TPA: hypothetical protein VEN28_01695 [Burkholderiaceae bacterium]|nr:hypothetical protein [Burkholderiaceae bacterium]
MKPASAATWVALALVAAAWLCRLLWIAVPALDVSVNHAAEALYLAELEYQHHGVAIVEAPSIESIATEVHRRTARVLIWIGLGLGLCLVAALAPHSRRVMIVVAGLVYLLGWIRLDAYAHVGLLQGLDLKLRLVQNDAGRLLQFAVIDGVLPLLVTCAIATTSALALRRA